jgi:hypothetical protein
LTPPSLPLTPPSLPLTPPSLPFTPPSLPLTPPSLPLTPPSLPLTPTSLPLTPTTTPTKTLILSTRKNNNSPSVPNHTCHDTKPASIPDLFQIDTTDNSAKLFFTPINNTNNFYISYSSTNTNAEEHGTQVTLTKEGIQNFTINLLKPNTTYYIKVRGDNGCMPGDWSQIMKIKTNSKIYYKNQSATINPNIKNILKTRMAKLVNNDKIKTTPNLNKSQNSKDSITNPDNSTSVLGTIKKNKRNYYLISLTAITLILLISIILNWFKKKK